MRVYRRFRLPDVYLYYHCLTDVSLTLHANCSCKLNVHILHPYYQMPEVFLSLPPFYYHSELEF